MPYPPDKAIDGFKSKSSKSYWVTANEQMKNDSVVWQYNFNEPKAITRLTMRFAYAGTLDTVTVYGKEDCSGKLFDNDDDNKLSRRIRRGIENIEQGEVDFSDSEVRFDVEPNKFKAYRCFAVNLTTYEDLPKYVGIREVDFYEGRFEQQYCTSFI